MVHPVFRKLSLLLEHSFPSVQHWIAPPSPHVIKAKTCQAKDLLSGYGCNYGEKKRGWIRAMIGWACAKEELTTMIGKWWIDGKNTLASFFLWYNRKYCQNTFTDIFLYSVFANHFKMFYLNFQVKIFHYLSKYFLFCYENSIWIFHAKNDIRLCFHQY